MQKLYLLLKYLGLVEGAIWFVKFHLIFGFIAIVLITKFVDIIWLKWLLLFISGGTLFYSIKDDIALYIRDETRKAVEKLDKQQEEITKGTYKGGIFIKNPTLNEGLFSWFKAIIYLALFILLLRFLF